MVQFSSFSTLDREFRKCLVSILRVRLTSELPAKIPSFPRKFLDQLFKGHLRDICFKLLPSSSKPLVKCFYIKILLNSSVFHSFNISKVIFNSFNSFWSLDYVFGGFYIHSWDFSQMSVGKFNFCQSFLLGFVFLNVYLLWMSAPCGKNNMYLGKIFVFSCIV